MADMCITDAKAPLRPLQYGELACKTLMKRFAPEQLPPAGALFYHQGVFLSGMEKIYFLTKKREYFEYIKRYIDCCIGKSGELFGLCHEITKWKKPETWPEDINLYALTRLDNKQPSILLYNLYDETRDRKYLNAAKTIGESMYFWPVNCYGGYWHMMTQPNQMWLDGAYMAGPLSMMYADRFDDPVLAQRAIRQIMLMNEHMRDSKTGLYYHGWDESRSMPWANEHTGLSGQFWSRAIGWYAVAILDILDYVTYEHPDRETLCNIEQDLLYALAKYQDGKSGMWFNVTDRIDEKRNWIETSGSCLFTYSFAKAIRKGIVNGEEYTQILKKAYNGIIKSLRLDKQGDLIIDHICVGTCIDSGTYEHYVSRPTVKNDLHGAGAFILMCAEMERYKNHE